MASIRLEGVWKRYGLVEAVKDLNLVCQDGELLALLGPSGCGKTSTLKMIAGIEDVTEGAICFDDRPVTDLAPGARNIAMVFEDYALYPHLSVAENIAFPLKIRKLPGDEIRQAVDGALRLLGLEAFQDINVKSLSGGAQQRVSIGRALVRRPELVLFDEPLSHLDGDHKVQLRGEIKRLQKETGLTSILVTHDQTEAVAMSDRVAVMNLGVLQQVGAPQELYDRPANLFVASFIGEPPMNLLRGALREEGGKLFLESEGWRIHFASDLGARVQRLAVDPRVVLGIRPEHVRLIPTKAEPREGNGLWGRVFCREPRGDAEVILVRLTGAPRRRDQSGLLTRELLTVEVPGLTSWADEDVAEVRLLEDRIHLFDAATGQNHLVGHHRDAGGERG